MAWPGDIGPPLGRPIATPLEQCAELLGVNLATLHQAAANVEPYLRADGTRIWSLMQLERQLRPEVYGWRRGGYLDSTVDERGSSTCSYAWARPDDQHVQKPQCPTPTCENA